MAEIIRMPRLSDTMEQGTVTKWLKKIGDKIQEGDILAEIETDKAIQEFEAFSEGTLLHIGVKEGESALVDSLLAIIGEEGSDFSSLLNDLNTEDKEESTDKDTQSHSSQLEDSKVKNLEPKSEFREERIKASPLAKILAKEKGVDLLQIRGTGENGRIIKRDIEGYSSSHTLQSSPKITFDKYQPIESQFQIEDEGKSIEVPNSQMRNVIAKRLVESKFQAPHYYLSSEVYMDNMISARNSINSFADIKISFNDLVVKVVAHVLSFHPMVNSSWSEDKIIQHGDINIGVAVAVTDGLLVPVLKFANLKSLKDLHVEVKTLAQKARSREINSKEMEGSTFTISNLGMFGIDFFTSIINQPNTCIMSVGSIVKKPIVRDEQIIVGNTMRISLACDHRVVDGVTGAAFLKDFKYYMENPMLLLL